MKKKKKFVSSVAKDKLSRLSSETLLSLNEIRKKDKLKDALLEVIRQMIDEEKDYVLKLNSADAKLSTQHANAKGRIAGLTVLMHLIEGSGEEIEKREEK